MIKGVITRKKRILIMLSAVLACILAYTALAAYQHNKNPKDTTVPTWSQLAEGVKKITEVNQRDHERWIVMDAEATFSRLFAGLAIGVSIGFVLGILMGCFPAWEAFWTAILVPFSKIPNVAMVAVFFVLFGIMFKMYAAMIAFVVIPTVAVPLYFAARDVPIEMVQKAYTLGASSAEIVWNVIVRQTAPKFIEALRVAVGPAFVALIAAEMLCASNGFGYRIRLEFKKINMDVVYPYLALLGASGWLMEQGLDALRRKCCPWYRNGR